MANKRPEPTSQVILDSTGLTLYYVKGDRVNKDLRRRDGTTAVEVKTSSGHSGYFSFKLAPPPEVSYLYLHWPQGPEESPKFPRHPPYSSVLAADKNLLLIRVAIPSLSCYYEIPHDLFVYTAAGSRPLLERLPLHNQCAREVFGKFFVRRSGIGILRLAGDEDNYIVADLIVDKPEGSGDYVAELCVFFSTSRTRTSKWEVFTITTLQKSAGGKFPVRWITSTVLPFDGRFLCWVDYFSGVLLLSGFSRKKGPEVKFLSFPGKQYPDEVRRGIGRCCPGRFRSLSISQGMMCFVHIDNHFHERMHMKRDDEDTVQPQEKPDSEGITIWTLNVGDFTWKQHRHIKLEDLRASFKDTAIAHSLPEFPVIDMDDPDRLWCILKEKAFPRKAWKIVVDMKCAVLHSCTPYVNDEPYLDENIGLKNCFANLPLLPLVLSKYLNNTEEILEDSDKVATPSSKRGRRSVQHLEFRPS